MVESRDDRTVVAGGSDGFGGGMGIWAILLLALLGGNGFGGRGNDAARETQLINDNMNSRFSSLEGMNEARFMAQANNINHVEAMESSRDNMREICETKNMIQSVGYGNSLIEKDTQLQMALGFKDAELRQQSCCCETNRNIDSVKFENEKQTAAILAAMAQDKYDRMAEKYDDMRLAYSQCQQNASLIAALGPKCAVPAYITNAPGQAVFPPYNAAQYNYGGFNGGGCCA